MHLAQLGPSLNAVLAVLPLDAAKGPDPGAVHQPVQRPIGAALRDLGGQRFLSTAQRREISKGQSSPAGSKRLATIAAVCRRGSLNGTLTNRQNWIARVEKTGGRPGRPSCGAGQVISLSSQIKKRTALPERIVVAGPIRRTVAGRCGLAHLRA